MRRVHAQLPELREAVWTRLSGGRTNRVWRVGDVVCKLFDLNAATPLFANDPMLEARVLEVLGPDGLSPRMRFSDRDEAGRFIVYDAVEGPLPQAPDAGLIHAFARLHHLPPIQGLPEYPHGFQAIIASGVAMLRDGPLRDDVLRLETLRPRNAPGTLPAVRTATLHRDAVAGNHVAGQGGTVLIDWQCPALGDPAEDLAIALSPAMQRVYGRGSFDEAALLRMYPDRDVVARYLALKPAFAWRMACYCAWKSAAGDRDYAAAAKAELRLLKQGE